MSRTPRRRAYHRLIPWLRLWRPGPKFLSRYRHPRDRHHLLRACVWYLRLQSARGVSTTRSLHTLRTYALRWHEPQGRKPSLGCLEAYNYLHRTLRWGPRYAAALIDRPVSGIHSTHPLPAAPSPLDLDSTMIYNPFGFDVSDSLPADDSLTGWDSGPQAVIPGLDLSALPTAGLVQPDYHSRAHITATLRTLLELPEHLKRPHTHLASLHILSDHEIIFLFAALGKLDSREEIVAECLENHPSLDRSTLLSTSHWLALAELARTKRQLYETVYRTLETVAQNTARCQSLQDSEYLTPRDARELDKLRRIQEIIDES